MSRRFTIVAVTLPLLLLIVMVVRAEWHLAHSQTWHFSIRGYDPRDLLRGHYMRFQLEVAVQEPIESCSEGSADCCYCLSRGEDIEPDAALASCSTAAAICDAYVNARALHGLNRFYIPEEGRSEMEAVLLDAAREDRAHLAVAVNGSGMPMIEALLIDGQPIRVATEEHVVATEVAETEGR